MTDIVGAITGYKFILFNKVSGADLGSCKTQPRGNLERFRIHAATGSSRFGTFP